MEDQRDVSIANGSTKNAKPLEDVDKDVNSVKCNVESDKNMNSNVSPVKSEIVNGMSQDNESVMEIESCNINGEKKDKTESQASPKISKYFNSETVILRSSPEMKGSDHPPITDDSFDMDLSKDEIPHQNGVSQDKSEVLHPMNVKELEEYCSASNREETCFIASKVPNICKEQPCILGIDEAGRGPVLGPMVYGVCYCPKSKEDDLKETGCADSKSLTEEKREKIFDEICKHNEYIGWEVEVIPPLVISTSMLRRCKVSLNEVSHNSAIGLLKRALDAGVLVSEVFVDTVGPAEKYEAKLKNLFPELIITVAKKADSTYPIVGGASICAKVTRDVALKSWTFSQAASSSEWGSGYPNDPVTKKFLTSTLDPIFGFSNIVRFSWSTAEKVLEENAVQIDWEAEEEPAKGASSVKSFFSPGEQKQHKFFRDRCLKNAVNL